MIERIIIIWLWYSITKAKPLRLLKATEKKKSINKCTIQLCTCRRGSPFPFFYFCRSASLPTTAINLGSFWNKLTKKGFI